MQNSLQCGQQSTTYILNMGLAGLFKTMVQGPVQTPPVECCQVQPHHRQEILRPVKPGASPA